MTEYTITGLTNTTDTHYIQIRAGHGGGDGEASDTVSATPREALPGTWTHAVEVRPNRISPGDTNGASVYYVATFRAAPADVGDLVALTTGTITGSNLRTTVEQTDPQVVGFGWSVDDGSLSHQGSVAYSTGTLSWTLRISSGVSKGIYKSVVQSDREFLRIGVGDR